MLILVTQRLIVSLLLLKEILYALVTIQGFGIQWLTV